MTTKVSDSYVYLDWAATAPLCEEAAEAMKPYLIPGPGNIAYGGNPNSLHSCGRAAFEALEYARRAIAADLGAQRPNEIIFTSGATESDDTAMLAISEGIAAERGWRTGSFKPHVITTEIEHDAILKPAKRLEQEGFRVTRLTPDRRGFITPDALRAAVDDDTVLVSVQMANSEVGSVQPIAELAAIAHEHGAFFHTDATQALGKVPVDVSALDIDAASFSAHKICGPKGVGALYVKAHAPFRDYLLGGGQEEGRRSGTQNVCGIVGFAAACHAAVSLQHDEAARERGLRDDLYRKLAAIDGVHPTVDVPAGSEDYLPNIVHVLVDGYESETMVLRLDMKGFGVSGGSACSSHSLDPSHVLLSMGIDGDRAYGALRISMGRYTTADELARFAEALKESLDWHARTAR